MLDTNVVVSALLWGGTPFDLLQAATDGPIQLYTSPALLGELHAVLARAHLAARLTQQRGDLDQAMAWYAQMVAIVSPPAVPRIVAHDADDDQVLAAGLAAQATLIVSGDRHLLSLASYQSIPILAPTQALAHINTVNPPP